ncbi:conserved hypothetical protein, membrane or secreted [Candidatus Omnitrophus magneticus]|uniref:BatD protein n=1 Tax=Candidatus Omnitrophus magneticus TaxID=1609969 RepID=A0A0F0CW16_9BACT|nr:conserved hypothetical protein, membrane or secreted [Candidatus Omnitrophus magneticus]
MLEKKFSSLKFNKCLLLFLIFFTTSILSFTETVKANNKYNLTVELEEETIYLEDSVCLNATFHGAQNVPQPDFADTDGLRVKYIGPSTQVIMVNRQISQQITHSFLLIPNKAGTFEIGPFKVNYDGQLYTSPPVRLKVISSKTNRQVYYPQNTASSPSGLQQQTQNSSAIGPSALPITPYNPALGGISSNPLGQNRPTSVAVNEAYESNKIFLVLEPSKTEAYVNESFPIILTLYVKDTGLKDIEYPVMEQAGFSAGEWQEPMKRQTTRNGVSYNVLIFRKDVSAIKEGKYSLGPVKMGCKIVERVSQPSRRRPAFFRSSMFDDDDFFSSMFQRYEVYPIELRADKKEITVLPFPENGKPHDFDGALGDFKMKVQIDSKEIRVGDPVTVKIEITGTGNMDTITAPKINIGENFKTYDIQSTKEKTRKVFEQILVPKTKDIKNIPEISFSFFNPDTRKYITLKEPPIPIKIIDRPHEEKIVQVVSNQGINQLKVEAPETEEKFGQDIIHIKLDLPKNEKHITLYNNKLFWLTQLLPLIGFLLFYFLYSNSERVKKDKKYARGKKAFSKSKKGLKKAAQVLSKNEIPRFYDEIFNTIEEYLGNKFNLPAGVITMDILSSKLIEIDMNETLGEMIKEVLAMCDMARYAPSLVKKEEADDIFEKVKKIIEQLEKVKS